MNNPHPYLVGRVLLQDNWSIDLPFVCQQRFEDNQMVLWRPGFTIWLSIWGNDTGESTETRLGKLCAATSQGKTNEKTTTNDGFTYYHYRIDEPSGDNRVAAFQGFAFNESGHVQMSTYFDHEAESVFAEKILLSSNNMPPSIGEPSVFSQLCFATNFLWIAAILLLLSWFAIAMVGDRLSISSYQREVFEKKWLFIAVTSSLLVSGVTTAGIELWKRKRGRPNHRVQLTGRLRE